MAEEEAGGKPINLTGADNYDIWSDKMEDHLYMKSQALPVFGEKPADMSDAAWATQHRVACGYIRSWCLPKVWTLVNKEKKDAKVLWKSLEETFAKKSGNNKLYIMMKIFNLKYVDGTPVSDHVNEFQRLADRLIQMGLKVDDELLGLWLLNSLPTSWENFRMSWSNSAPGGIVSLSYARNGVDNEDMRRKTLAMSSASTSNDALVTHRGRSHGDDGGSRDRSKSRSRRVVKCFHCGEKGHFRRDCWKLKEERDDRDHERKGKGRESGSRVAAAYADHGDGLVIACLDENLKVAHLNTSWLLDSGASRHVTPRREFFASYTPGNYGALKMGNGGKVRVIGVGDVVLETKTGGRLVLKNVRHAPQFGMNVISSGCLDQEGYESTLGSGRWKLTRGSLVVAKIPKISSLYVLEAKVVKGNKRRRRQGSSSSMHEGHKMESLITGVDMVSKPNCAVHLVVKERRLSWAIDSIKGELIGGRRLPDLDH